ncbi:hypothetical protein GC177_06270 [bacterium]|nr:hypothetical protein [bacterium]
MKQHAIHQPAEDYGSLSTEALQEKHHAMMTEVHALEHPGWLTRITRAGGRVAAAVAGFGATLLAADRAFLAKGRALLGAEAAAPGTLEQKDDATLVAETYGTPPEGQQLAWPCEGCPGCPGGMAGCRPTFKPKDDARFTPATVERAAEWLRNRLKQENPGHTPIQRNTYDRQLIAAGAAASGVGLLMANLADRLLGKPERAHLHELRHELQHIEDELAARSRMEALTASQPAKVA